MTLSGIKLMIKNIKDNYNWMPLLVKACPQLKYTARSDAVKYYGYSDVDQDKIKQYLLHHYDYDVIDISHIIKEYNYGIVRQQ